MWLALDIPPGLYRNGTELQAASRWRDASLVRWQEGAMQPVGGWRPRVNGSGVSVDTDTTPRTAHAWGDESGNRWLALGSFDALYVMDDEGATFDITPAGFTSGRLDSDANFGWGGGTWGTLWWGQPRPDSGAINPATVWHLDNWGEFLVGCSPDDGKLYEWQLNTATAAATITNAPTGCSGLIVTEERFMMALGAGGDPRKVQWSDRENNTVWTPAATNEAGDYRLQTSGSIERAIRVRGQTLILTNQDAHTATPDPSFVYGFERVGTACGVISRGAAIGTKQGAVWMGVRGFYRYFGGSVEEIPCEVSDYVFTDMNQGQVSKIVAVNNSEFGEVWWFYPSANSTENDRYVAYDMRENIWMTGTLSRTCGVDVGTFRLPLFVEPGGIVYEHEVGLRYGDSGATSFAETGPIALGAGQQIMQARKLYPDERTQGDVTVTFKTRFFPNGTESEFGPYSMSEPTSVRFSGRQARMRVTAAQNADWRVGIMRLEGDAGGMR